MMASSEDRNLEPPVRLTIPALLMLLGFVTVFGFVANGQLTLGIFSGPQGAQMRGALLFNLILVASIWGLSWLKPSKAKILAQLVLLAFAAFIVSGAMAAILGNMHARDFAGLWYWKTLGLIAGNVLVLAGALCGIWMIRPWKTLKGQHEPVSPATRRTKLLFGLSGVVSVLAVAVLLFGGGGDGRINPVWSNSQNISPVIAVLAVAIWLAAIALSWWWYYSADEHERRANDVGFLIGGGLFMAATPVWWLGYRAGLVPAPDAMILWYATIVAMGIGWGWYRSR